MPWSKKETLFFLSLLVISVAFGFSSCQSNQARAENLGIDIPANHISVDEVITEFFETLQIEDESKIQQLDSLGHQIHKVDSTILFFPFQNKIESNAFVFTGKIHAINKLLNNSVLDNKKSVVSGGYQLWRLKFKNAQLIDISKEPHPTLDWIVVIRFRGQE